MTKGVLLVGAGGHALVSAEVLENSGRSIAGVLARDASRLQAGFPSIPHLGGDDAIPSLVPTEYAHVFVAIGDNRVRGARAQEIIKVGGELVVAASPSAVISTKATLDQGVLVMSGAVVNPLVSVTLAAIVNTGAIVEHECTVGAFAHIAPGAVLAGSVQVGEGALVGVGARVLPGRRVGAWATVGAGAVVVDDVPDGSTVVGVPARPVIGAAPDTKVRPDPERPRVLVVCTGNLCRSPLAEAMLVAGLAQADVDAHVRSAGVAAPDGAQPDRKLIRVAGEHGVDVEGHRSRRLTRDDVRAADLVLVMTRGHARQVRDLDPSADQRTVPLRVAAWKARMLAGSERGFAEWVAGLTADVPEMERPTSARADDIPDPIGKPLRHYRSMADEVHSLVDTLVRYWGGRRPT